jgi:hypothetical protein
MKIDTKEIRTELEDSRLLIHAKVNFLNPLFDVHPNDVGRFILLLSKLCDSHDELERKLKIAEDALIKIDNQPFWRVPDLKIVLTYDTIIDFAGESLKQIRGEE